MNTTPAGLVERWTHEADTMLHGTNAQESAALVKQKRELAAELAQSLQAAPEWRPIDSAPKDGTEILIYFARDGVGVRQVAYTEGANNDYESWCVDDLKFGPYPLRRWCDGDAIAWMPLPASPAPAGG